MIGVPDNLVYSLWSFNNKNSDIDHDFINKCHPVIWESMKEIDIVIFLPMTKEDNIKIVDNGTRETDISFINEIDSLFSYVISEKSKLFENTEIYNISGNRTQRLNQFLDIKNSWNKNNN